MFKSLKAFIGKFRQQSSLAPPANTEPEQTSNAPVADPTAHVYGDAEMTENLKRLIASGERANVEMAFQILKGTNHPAVEQIPANAPPDTKEIWLSAYFNLPFKHARAWVYCLDLQKCNLQTLPPYMGRVLNHICIVNLCGNKLQTFPDTVESEKNNKGSFLTAVYLNKNHFHEFPSALLTQKGLSSIGLAHNQISEVPERIANLIGLRHLSMGYNRSLPLPSNIGSLEALRTLLWQGNAVSEVPVSISQCVCLRDLNLSHNQIDKFPNALQSIKTLRILNLCDNQLALSFENTADWTDLRELNLNRNNLKSLSLKELNELQRLFAVGNHIQEIFIKPGGLRNLRKLHLHHNQLRFLPETLGSLKSLRELRLYNNRLENLPESIGNLEQLRYLSLDRNNLTALPGSIGNLKKLEQLEISENNLPDTEKARIQSLLPHTYVRF